MRVRGPNQTYTAEQRIGACADYLLGKPYTHIAHKWNVKMETVYGCGRAVSRRETPVQNRKWKQRNETR